jgi:transcriptional regulator with XRE-family HTH domain
MKKITQKDLAEYLGLSAPTISEYKKNPVGKKKLDLMLKGLELMQYNQSDLLKLKNKSSESSQ